jgi:hypothetical protein
MSIFCIPTAFGGLEKFVVRKFEVGKFVWEVKIWQNLLRMKTDSEQIDNFLFPGSLGNFLSSQALISTFQVFLKSLNHNSYP